MISTTIVHEFALGSMVVLKTDPEKHKRLIVSLQYNVAGTVMYALCVATEVSYHYEQEIEEICIEQLL